MNAHLRGLSPTWWDHLVGLALLSAYTAVLLVTVDNLGLARDESIYVHAADSYLGWYERLVQEPSEALSPGVIARHFRVNREHPAFIKTLFGLAHKLDETFVLFPSPSTGYRLVGMVCSGGLLWLLYIMGVRYGGRHVGLFAALAYALLPRPFYHAHLNCFDVPITLAVTLVVQAYLRALGSRRWAIYCGLLFGLALATKHNSWILPGIFAIHFGFVIVQRRRARRVDPAVAQVSATPWWLLSMLLLGLPVLVATWPWLWHDSLERFGWYARFHWQHEYYNMAYFGVNHFRPPFPISYPWVMTLFTVPITTTVLALAGMFGDLRLLWSRLWRPAICPDPTYPFVLYLGALFAPLVLISLPDQPIFGGTKHWMTAYPFMCLFSGVGFARFLAFLRGRFAVLEGGRAGSAVTAVILAGLLLPAVLETSHSHPFGLSHYGVAVGGVPGAADLGMNRQFWGYTTGSLVDYLNARLPGGGRVYVCDTTTGAFRMLAEDGLVRPDIQPTHDISRADLALVHHEHHFAEVDFQIWALYGTVQPSKVLRYDGVPIISVYANPSSRRVRR